MHVSAITEYKELSAGELQTRLSIRTPMKGDKVTSQVHQSRNGNTSCFDNQFSIVT